MIGYHNQVIYRNPLTLNKNCNSIANLIDNEAIEIVLRNEELTEEEKQLSSDNEAISLYLFSGSED